MVAVAVGAEDVAGIEGAVHGRVEVIDFNKLLEAGAAHEVLLCAIGIVKVKGIDTKLVGHYDIGIIRYAARHPVMSADGFEPPDFVDVLEGDAVHFIGAIRLMQHAEALDTFAGRVNIRQSDGDEVLFTDSSGNLFFTILCGLIDDQRIGGENTFIGRECLRCRHGDVGIVDACRCPYAFNRRIGLRHACIAHRIVRQSDGQMRDDRVIGARLLVGLDDDVALGREASGTGILVAGNEGGSVDRCIFSYKKCCAGHRQPPLTAVYSSICARGGYSFAGGWKVKIFVIIIINGKRGRDESQGQGSE